MCNESFLRRDSNWKKNKEQKKNRPKRGWIGKDYESHASASAVASSGQAWGKKKGKLGWENDREMMVLVHGLASHGILCERVEPSPYYLLFVKRNMLKGW